ncbi:MAG TPA: oligopeptide transporter, OPT family [Thermoanaerobaculia bacterium]|jgi:putative OPT family oligopeptide transporter|nr:oligopeptide transporter, OPT family [Thermoanaerobaculia bacterium]
MNPPLSRDESVVEFTLRAALAGIFFGILFGGANAYLGLRVGLTVSTSIPIAVLTVALFRLMRRRAGGMILEANLAQTIGSASSSLASGTIFTIPALFLWGMVPPLWQIAGLAFLGAILGITAMVPLRRLLIVKNADELPYPEGTACAEVLRATAAEASGGRWIFIGLAVGALIKIAIGAAVLIEPGLSAALPGLPKAEVALEIAPALLAVGYILGYRQSSVMVSGSLISALVLTPLIALVGAGLAAPLFPEATTPIAAMTAGQIWSRYVRYIGAGAVAAAGIVTVLRALPVMSQSFTAVLLGMRRQGTGPEVAGAGGPVPRTDRDVPGWVVLAGPVIVILALVSVPGLIAGNMGFVPRLAAAVGVGIFGILFVVVSSRIVGLIGVSSNPTSGMTLVTLLGVALIFVLCGWTDPSARAAILTVGTVVCIAASKAGDISQDLKTGFLVGATPAKQQAGQFLGAAFACWAVAGIVLLLGKAYTFGSPELPAPQATLMKTVIDGVLSGSLPWGLVGTGAAFSLSGLLAGLPGLAFAVGLYLPLGSLTPIFLGGLIRRLVEARRSEGAREGDPGILAASGMIAGEGLAGVAIAGLAAAKTTWPESGWSQRLDAWHIAGKDFAWITGPAGAVVGIALVLGVSALLYRAGRSGEGDATEPAVNRP